jgi:hypothetical protein
MGVMVGTTQDGHRGLAGRLIVGERRTMAQEPRLLAEGLS